VKIHKSRGESAKHLAYQNPLSNGALKQGLRLWITLVKCSLPARGIGQGLTFGGFPQAVHAVGLLQGSLRHRRTINLIELNSYERCIQRPCGPCPEFFTPCLPGRSVAGLYGFLRLPQEPN